MKLFVRLANCTPVRVVEVNLPPTATVTALKQRVQELTGINEFKQKIYCAGQHMEPDAPLGSFELIEGTELKLLVKMSIITNKPTAGNLKPVAAAPARAAGVLGVAALASKLHELGSDEDDEPDGSDPSEDAYSVDEEEAILHAAMTRINGADGKDNAANKRSRPDDPPKPR